MPALPGPDQVRGEGEAGGPEEGPVGRAVEVEVVVEESVEAGGGEEVEGEAALLEVGFGEGEGGEVGGKAVHPLVLVLVLVLELELELGSSRASEFEFELEFEFEFEF
jgi:hypothetical protein